MTRSSDLGEPGRDEHKATAQSIYSAFPDLRHEIHELVAEGDVVALRATPGGTHEGEFLGIAPTGKKLQFDVMAFFRIVDGKIDDAHQTALRAV